MKKRFCKILRNFGFRSVQRVLILVDLKNCFKNEYLDAKIGVDTEENEPSKVLYFYLIFIPPQGFNFHIPIRPGFSLKDRLAHPRE